MGMTQPLTLVVALAGFGKTTLLVEAMRGHHGPVGWLTLDEHDNHLPTFVRHLVGAIRTAIPNACPGTLGLLRQPRGPAAGLIARGLAGELASIPTGCVVIIDEYEAIRNPTIDALIEALLQHPTSGLHLVIAGRTPPRLRLSRLRARGQLTEIGAAELRCTPEEIRAVLAPIMGSALSDDLVSTLVDRTDGWVAALRLIAMSLESQTDVAALRRVLAGPSVDAIDDFLLDEVMRLQPPAVQEVLINTSPFDRVCAALCDAVFDETSPPGSSAAHIAYLDRHNLFFSATGGDDGWYRYHALFRDALRRQFDERTDPAARSAIHRRASRWFAEQGLVDEALQHALLADDIDEAARIVEDVAFDALSREDWFRVDQWLRRLPDSTLAGRPHLLVARAWTLHLRYRLDEMPAILSRLESHLGGVGEPESPPDDASRRSVWGQVQTLRAGVELLPGGDPQRAFERAWRGWQYLPSGFPLAQRVAPVHMALAAQSVGRGDEARDELERALEVGPGGNPVYESGIRFALTCLDLANGAYQRVEAECLRKLQAAELAGQPVTTSWAHYLLGLVYYEWNELTEAQSHFEAVLALADRAHFLASQGSQFGLAITQQVLGRVEAAEAIVNTMLDVATQTWSPVHLSSLRSFQARLALHRGDAVAAARWSTSSAVKAMFRPSLAFEVPELTAAWARIAIGTRVSLREAKRLTEQLVLDYRGWHDVPRCVRALALDALASDALDDTDGAIESVARAVELAQPIGMVRTFVDLGRPMADLIERHAVACGTTVYLTRVIAAFESVGVHADGPHRLPSVRHADNLTAREAEILRLLERRLTNREIATLLAISWQTVAQHTKNICSKLGVSGRREAVARARERGLLEGDRTQTYRS
jgi:LuxR family maltose regulon positive regulatory protein